MAELKKQEELQQEEQPTGVFQKSKARINNLVNLEMLESLPEAASIITHILLSKMMQPKKIIPDMTIFEVKDLFKDIVDRALIIQKFNLEMPSQEVNDVEDEDELIPIEEDKVEEVKEPKVENVLQKE